MSIINKFINIMKFYYYKDIVIPDKLKGTKHQFSKYNVASIENTMKVLLRSNKSMSRFGNGEFEGIFDANENDLEENTPLLHKKLLEVLHSNNDKLMVSLPDGFRFNKYYVSNVKYFWEKFCIQYGKKILPLLKRNKIYYNACVSRPYIEYNTKFLAKRTFKMWKQFWNNKNILIVEGNKSRLGVDNDLFNNVKNIKRIECPYKNAFEKYDIILYKTIAFLKRNPDYCTLIALGQTATVLAYDLCNNGFRGIDIGNIDLEYEWYLMGAKEKVDIPSRYVNEVQNGGYASPIHDNNYKSEIIYSIK